MYRREKEQLKNEFTFAIKFGKEIGWTPVKAIGEGAHNNWNENNEIDIYHDVWFHVAMRVSPEDVQTFALVCKQFSRLVSSQAYWRNVYKRYCRTATKCNWEMEFPAHLEEQLQNCDAKDLRTLVIKSLFHCYLPLEIRVFGPDHYTLDFLLRRTFVSCYQKQIKSLWVMCYTLWNQHSSQQSYSHGLTAIEDTDTNADVEVVDDWETLAVDDDQPTNNNFVNRHEGVVLLIVVGRKFMPIPNQLLYNPQQTVYRLNATRELISSDMRFKHLELDFVEDNHSSSPLSVTVKHSLFVKYKVLPWWHPDFKTFLK